MMTKDTITIGILMPRPKPNKKSLVIPEVIRRLGEWGVKVDIIHPDEELYHLSSTIPTHDLYILKDSSDLALGFAGMLHAAKAAIINSYAASVILRDKISSTGVMKMAKLPVPETYITTRLSQLAPVLKQGPVIIKPYRGTNGKGIKLITSTAELRAIPEPREPIFAQRYHKPEGLDNKIYVIDGLVFGVARKWPAKTYKEKLGMPITINESLRELALRCAAAFGVKMLGLDIVISKGQPYIVDVQSFPGFKGVPNAALRLADYFYHVALTAQAARRQLILERRQSDRRKTLI